MKENRVNEFIKNPKKALLTLSYPILVGMLVQTLYNVVDTAFVGWLGVDAIAALTFSFPLFFILIALNAGIGSGVSSRIARFLGENNKEGAENTAMHGLLLAVIVSLASYVVGFFVLKELFVLFGASGIVLQYAMDYMFIVLLGSFFIFIAYTIHAIFSAQGDTKTAMKIQVFALVLNVILDPILIYGLGYGIKGAAIATVISFAIGLALGIYYLMRKSYLKINPHAFRFSRSILKDILYVGMPASITMFIISAYVIFINWFMVDFGTEYVAAFGIASRLESVAMMPLVAFGISALTLIGMFIGAKRFDLVKETSWYTLKIGVGIASVVGAVFFIFPQLFIGIFTPEISLIEITAPYIMINVFTFPLMAVSTIVSRIMQGLGHGLPGLVINLIRVFFVAIPLAYFFVFILGYGYLWIAVAMVIGGIVSNIIAFGWLVLKFRGFGKIAAKS